MEQHKSGSRFVASVEMLEGRALFASTLVPVVGNEIVYDQFRNQLYITTDAGTVERYDIYWNRLLSPVMAGVKLLGADISADGSSLYVADGGAKAVRKVNLYTGTASTLPYTSSHDGYAWDLKIVSWNRAVFTAQFPGSGRATVRQIDTATDTVTGFRNGMELGQGAPLSRSADRNSLLWQQPNISSGPIALYDAATDQIVASRGTSQSLGHWQSVSADGRWVALALREGVTLLDRSLANVQSFPSITGNFVFSPSHNILYGVDASADQVIAYDLDTRAVRFRVDIGEDVAPTRQRFGAPVAISADESRIFVGTATGVRIIDLPAADGRASRIAISGLPLLTSDGTSQHFTVSLLDHSGGPATEGTVHFSSSDPAATLPADYTFSAADRGVHEFVATFGSVGQQSLTVQIVGSTSSTTNVQIHSGTPSMLPMAGQQMAYDAVRNDVWISKKSGRLQQFDLDTGTLYRGIPAGISLTGIDVSPDGRYLITIDARANQVVRMDLETHDVQTFTYAPDGGGEGYGWDIKAIYGDVAVFSSQFNGSGTVQARQINIETGQVSQFLSTWQQGTPLARSADYNTLFWQGANSTDGPIILYDAISQEVIATDSTNRILGYMSAVSPDGQFMVMPLGSTMVLDRALINYRRLDEVSGAFTFDPTRHLFYGVNLSTSEVIGYDTRDWLPVSRASLAAPAKAPVGPFGAPMLSTGKQLLVSTQDGIQVMQLGESAKTELVVNGTGGDDTITVAVWGTDVIVVVNGTMIGQRGLAELADVRINGLSGNDSISVLGNVSVPAVIYGGDGDDTITGGAMNDTIYGNFGSDQVNGGIGDDSIMAGLGADLVNGDTGNDRIWGGDDSDTLYAGDGNDYVEGKGKSDSVYGGDGNDTILGQAGDDLIYGERGDDDIYVNDGAVSAFHDRVYGGDGADRASFDVLDQIYETEMVLA